VPHRSLSALRLQVAKDDITISSRVKALYRGFEPPDPAILDADQPRLVPRPPDAGAALDR